MVCGRPQSRELISAVTEWEATLDRAPYLLARFCLYSGSPVGLYNEARQDAEQQKINAIESFPLSCSVP